MDIVRTIKMSKAEHDVIKDFLNIIQIDKTIKSYCFKDICDTIMAEDNLHRIAFNIEYTDKE